MFRFQKLIQTYTAEARAKERVAYYHQVLARCLQEEKRTYFDVQYCGINYRVSQPTIVHEIKQRVQITVLVDDRCTLVIPIVAFDKFLEWLIEDVS